MPRAFRAAISVSPRAAHFYSSKASKPEQNNACATTAFRLNISDDDGANWKFAKLDSAWQYTRSIVERPDRTGVIFMTNGNGAPGWQGRLWRSRDFGRTWEDAGLPAPVESSLYFLAANRADP